MERGKMFENNAQPPQGLFRMPCAASAVTLQIAIRVFFGQVFSPPGGRRSL
jgi:hypothetical protein